MKPYRVFFLTLLVLVFVPVSFGQTARAEQERALLRRQTMRPEKRIDAELDIRLRQMQGLEASSRVPSAAPNSGPYGRERAEWLRRIREVRKVPVADLDRYRDFLKEDKTGIVRLLPNFDCLATNVINVSGDCSGFVPETSDFSFRTKDYSMGLFHDIGFNKDTFISNAFFAQGILVSLGDVPIETLDARHDGLRFLADFSRATDPRLARLAAERIAAGIETGGYRYSNAVKAFENTTYALRQVAYRLDGSGQSLRDPKTREEIYFLSLSADTRDDITIAFRVVKKEPDGVLTILWRELARTDAPKLRFAKGEPLSDFRPGK